MSRGNAAFQGGASRARNPQDTSTPAGKMVFTVLRAVAELERSLTVEQVKAGLRNAKAKGKRISASRA